MEPTTENQEDKTVDPKSSEEKRKIMVIESGSGVGMVGRGILHKALADIAKNDNLDIVVVDMESKDFDKQVDEFRKTNNSIVKDSIRAFNEIQTLEKMPKVIDRSYPTPSQIINTGKAIGRNQACHCGSGTKYKKCHGK